MNDKKVVLVTGASRGIGRAIALEFGRRGFMVLVNYVREQEKAAATAAAIVETGGTARCLQADVGDPAQVDRMIDDIAAREGRIDVLVCNAGLARDAAILRMAPDAWQAVLQTNLTGTFLVLQRCVGLMARRKEGAVVTVGSIAGVRGAAGAANYASAKAGVAALTKSASRELGRFNIRVNAVFPGFHLTDLGRSVPEAYVRRAREESVLGCTTSLDELAAFVVFLAGTQTVSGQLFNWDSRII
jgi:3-oxoacyl-[acyl-carrier protein] reductase